MGARHQYKYLERRLDITGVHNRFREAARINDLLPDADIVVSERCDKLLVLKEKTLCRREIPVDLLQLARGFGQERLRTGFQLVREQTGSKPEMGKADHENRYEHAEENKQNELMMQSPIR